MANEIGFSASLSVQKVAPGASVNASGSATQTGTDYVQKTIALSVTPAALVLGDIATLGFLFVKNLDAVITVSLSLASGSQVFATLLAGQFCLLPPATSTIYAVAASGTPSILILAVEI